MIGNAVEALIAAVYLDGGIEAARGAVEALIVTEAALGGSGSKTLPGSAPKSALQEVGAGAQAGHSRVPRPGGKAAPSHRRTFTVEVRVGRKCRAAAEGPVEKGGGEQSGRRGVEDSGEWRMSRVARPARFLLFFLPLFVLFAEVTPEISEAAKRKLDRIARALPRERRRTIVLSEDEFELLSASSRQGPAFRPGVEDVTVRLREGGATVEAVVDPETVGRLTREDTPLALRLLLRGRPQT